MDNDTFITIGEERSFEFEEKKSVFIANAFVVQSVEEAENAVLKIKKRYPDATHHCYAYVLKSGSYRRFNDDGEPSGTAGMPILNVIEHLALSNTLVVVTRYFGGIKLGAGGLVRAYSTAAAQVLTKAGKSVYVKGSNGTVEVDYDDYAMVERYLASKNVIINNKVFGNGVEMTVTTSLDWNIMENDITDMCRGGALCEFIKNVYVKQNDE